MPTFFSTKQMSLQEACGELLSLIKATSALSEHATFAFDLSSIDEALLFGAVSGTQKIFYKCRDSDETFFGLGVADSVSGACQKEVLFEAYARASVKIPGHIYFGACKFDGERACSPEWASFQPATFILPMVLVIKTGARCTLYLNYRAGRPFRIWCDDAATILAAIGRASHSPHHKLKCQSIACTPTAANYKKNFYLAQEEILKGMQKVVLARRRHLHFEQPIEPFELLNQLKNSSPEAFVFFFDMGKGAAFFGASPELLYRRVSTIIETESLAGSRARSSDRHVDVERGNDLLTSLKDNQEHKIVSHYIEDTLRAFAIDDLTISELELMTLPYVHHLVKRYQGHMKPFVSDAALIHALHPTPAVCGIEKNAAQQFIREHESFDRGLYAGYVGYISDQKIEFSVGIRSALLLERDLYVYVGGGIVAKSDVDAEWAELDNKERKILDLF